MAAYIATKFEQGPRDNPALEWRLLRQQIADLRPGWAMSYIDQLPWYEIDDLLDYTNGKAKAHE